MSTLTGCFYWIRAYQTYLQMDNFDQNFSITADKEFEVFFKDPILYNDDFISLSKLQPSVKKAIDTGESWRYWFRKVDRQGNIIQPEVKFYFDLDFNKEERLTKWTFSELFLQIAPAEFLEISIRSLGGAEINKGKRQIKANTDSIEKIDTKLPQRAQMLSQLGQPLEIEHEEAQDIYHYHFQLETQDIKEGYEDRALSVVKLTFDNSTDELLKMSGRFIGLKISINYQKFVKK
jgi:predicted phage tail protein